MIPESHQLRGNVKQQETTQGIDESGAVRRSELRKVARDRITDELEG